MSGVYLFVITMLSLLSMYLLGWISYELLNTRREVKEIMATMQEMIDAINGVAGQLVKAKDEILAKIQVLEDALANAGIVPAEAQVALDALKTAAQALDDVVPDVPA